jgi:hypothetical protein
MRALVCGAMLLVLGCGSSSDGAAQIPDGSAPIEADAAPAPDMNAAPAADAALTRADAAAPQPVLDSRLYGSWNVTFAYFTPDGGQTQTFTTLLGKVMTLTADARFTFNGGGGTWTTAPIVTGDWARWGVGPYANTRKIIETQDNGFKVDGPIEESGLSVFGFKIHYHTMSPAGRVDIELGRSKK